MRVLIAEDDLTSRMMLQRMLEQWGHEVTVTTDGQEAWETLRGPDSPPLAILDWMMPEMDGVEVCRRVQELGLEQPPYLILLTTKDRKQDIVEGLGAGANDHVSKPFHQDELRARLAVGARVIELQRALADRVHKLEEALEHVKTLQGILPICMHCHKIRSDQESWQRIEKYLTDHTDAQFSHGLCPDCLDRYYPET